MQHRDQLRFVFLGANTSALLGRQRRASVRVPRGTAAPKKAFHISEIRMIFIVPNLFWHGWPW